VAEDFFMKTALLLASLLLSLGATPAQARGRSTITFGRSAAVQEGQTKKRSFKHDIEAVSKSHESWKRAHLNSVLYSCQRNSERVAILARKVSDKIEAAKNEATSSAKVVEKILKNTLGEKADTPDLLAQVNSQEAAELRGKLKLIASARKRGQVLERLAGQVMKFYLNDVPHSSASEGRCQTQYNGALEKGVSASKQYHSDASALSQKLEGLVKLAETALRKRQPLEIVAVK
jgi:hypothetical protein